MRRTLVVAVATLAVLAGCLGGLTGGPDDPTTTTDPPAETTDAATVEDDSEEDGDGSDDGGTDVDEDGSEGDDDGTATGTETTVTAADDRAPWPPDDGPPRMETPGGERPDLPYSATEVLCRVERLRALNATDDVRLIVEPAPRWLGRNQTRTFPDEYGDIRADGALALQLDSEVETEKVASPGLAHDLNPKTGVTVRLWRAEDLERFYGEDQQVVLAHELVHVLQFQHEVFGFGELDTTDELLTHLALTEGDAVLTHEEYRERYGRGDGGFSSDEYNRTVERPRWMFALQNQAYYHGYRYYDTLNLSGEERTRRLEDPLNTTSAILHPGSGPRDPVGTIVNPEIEGFEAYESDRPGELSIRVALRANGIPVEEARSAGTGWRNGWMTYYRNASDDDRTLVYWRTTWANESEAAEFARTWRAMLEKLGATERNGTYHVPEGTHDNPNLVVIDREGSTVDVVTVRADDFEEHPLAGVESPASGSAAPSLRSAGPRPVGPVPSRAPRTVA